MSLLHLNESLHSFLHIHSEIRMKELLTNPRLVEHRMISYDLTSKLACHTNWGNLSCQSVEIDVVRAAYTETAIAYINGFFSKTRELGEESTIKANHRMSLMTYFGNFSSNRNIEHISHTAKGITG